MRWSSSHPEESLPRRPRAEVVWPDLHICPDCSRTFVVPRQVVDVIDADRFLVELECMNCGWREISQEGDQRLEALDRELDRQTADMREALELAQLTRRMDEIDAFARALQAGHILPEDF